MKNKTRKSRPSSRAGVTDKLISRPLERRFRRRSFIKGAGAAVAAGAFTSSNLGGCANFSDSPYDTPPSTAPAGKELRTLHFDLSHSDPDDQHYVQIYGRKYELFRHTDETLQTWADTSSMLSTLALEKPPTHYSLPLPFPEEFLQLAQCYRTSDKHKIPQFVLGSIHIPEQALKRHHERAMAGEVPLLHPSKLDKATKGLKQTSDGGVDLPDYDDFKNLADYHDISDAATWVVFQHPDIISLDADQAATIMSYLQSSSSFLSLEIAIAQLGVATSPDESGEYTGWCNGYYKKGPSFAPINGEQIYTSTGEAMWFVEAADEVKAAAGPVAIDALNSIRNDNDLKGSRYDINSGVHAEDVSGSSITKQNATACSGSAVHAFDHQDQWRHGAKITMDSSSTDKQVTFTVHNSFFLFRGCYIGFKDASGNYLDLADIADDFTIDGASYESAQAVKGKFAWLGSVQDRFRILGIPIDDEATNDWTVTIPDAATAIEVFAGTASTHFTSEFTRLDSTTFSGLEKHGAMATSIVDMVIPGLGLAAGIGGAVLSKLEKDVASLLLEFFVFVVSTITDTLVVADADAGPASFEDIVDIVMWFITQSADVLSEAFGLDEALLKGLTTFWAKISEDVAEAAAEEEAQESVPIIGTALTAIDILGTAAEIAETSVDIALSSKIMSWTANRVHDVRVTVHHDENDTQFPAVSTKAIAVLQLANAQTLTQELALTETELQVSTMEFEFCGVPEGGKATFTVTYLSENDWVAGVGSVDFENVTADGEDVQDVSVTIEERQVPLTSDTEYSSAERLDWVSDAREWVDDTTGPTATLSAQDCSAGGNRLCQPESITVSSRYGQLGYTWQASGTAVAGCASGTSQGAQRYQAQNVSFSGDIQSGNPEAVLMQTSCGSEEPTFVGYDLTGDADGNHFFLDASTGTYHLRKIVLEKDGSYSTKSYGAFAATAIKSFAIHPGSYACALNANGRKLEVLTLPTTPFDDDDDAWQATQVAGPGTQVGTLLGGVAVAATANGSSFLVLENINKRIQCFSRFGDPVLDFFDNDEGETGKSSWTPLYMPDDATYLDLGVESAGYIYVLGHQGSGTAISDYFLDIYLPTGAWLSRTEGVAAARMTVDLWRSVWSMDWEAYTTSAGNTEPIIRRWIPSTPAG